MSDVKTAESAYDVSRGSGEWPAWLHRLRELFSADTDAASALNNVRGRDALAVLEAAPDATLVLDGSGRVSVASQAASNLLGRGAADIIGRPFDLLLHPDSRAVAALRVRWLLDDAASHLVVDLEDLTILRGDGTMLAVSVRMSRIPVRRGLALCVTVRDQSQAHRRELELQEERDRRLRAEESLTASLRAVSDRAIVVTDAEGVVTAINRATEKMFGYLAAEVVGRPLSMLSDADDLASAASELGIEPGLDPLLEVTRSGLPNALDWTFVSKSGERLIVGLKIVPVGATRDPRGFVCVAHQELTLGWQPTAGATSDRMLLALDDAPTRTLRWQFRGGSPATRRR